MIFDYKFDEKLALKLDGEVWTPSMYSITMDVHVSILSETLSLLFFYTPWLRFCFLLNPRPPPLRPGPSLQGLDSVISWSLGLCSFLIFWLWA